MRTIQIDSKEIKELKKEFGTRTGAVAYACHVDLAFRCNYLSAKFDNYKRHLARQASDRFRIIEV